jgi:hypothetical protein
MPSVSFFHILIPCGFAEGPEGSVESLESEAADRVVPGLTNVPIGALQPSRLLPKSSDQFTVSSVRALQGKGHRVTIKH